MKTIILQTLAPVNRILTNSAGRRPCAAQRGFLLIPLILMCFALCQQLQSAADPPKQAQSAPDVARQSQSALDTPEQSQNAPDTPDPGPLPATNTGDGQLALGSLTTGTYNSAFGIFSLLSLTDGSFCTGVGAGALLSNTASENTAVGAGALFSNTTGGSNTATGAFALFANSIGVENTAVGRDALLNSTSSDNTAVGLFALLTNVDGSSNTAVGAAALRINVSGVNNQAFGRGALRNTTGSSNIGIGREAGANQTSGDNVISIGSPGDATAFDVSNRCYIGNIRGVVVGNLDGINVIVDSDGQLGTSNSSRRFKKDIKPMDQTSEVILALKPVTFHYKNADTKKAGDTPQFGLIAEDVAEVNSDLVVRDAEGEPLTVRYDAVNAMLLNEFLKEHKKVEEQQTNITQLNFRMANQAAIIAQQQKGIELLTAQLKEQAAQIQKVSAQLDVSKPAAQVVSYEQ
jgi:Chaperone of endosialidase